MPKSSSRVQQPRRSRSAQKPPEVSKKPKYAIHVIYYKELKLCIEQIKVLRLFNPDIQIHGVFGGNDTHIEYYDELQTYLDSNWQHPEANSYWKWISTDIMAIDWYEAFGKNLDWDYLYLMSWDLLLIEPLSNLIPPQAPDEIYIVPEVESFKRQRTWNNHWMGDNNGVFREFKRKLSHYFHLNPATIEENIQFVNSFFWCCSREFIEALCPVIKNFPGMIEYRIPTLAPLLGFKTDTPENLKKRDYLPFANTGKREIPTFTIINELEKQNPFPYYHPVYTTCDTDIIRTYFNIENNRVTGRVDPARIRKLYPNKSKNTKNYAILYLYYSEFEVCKDRLNILRILNPGVPIYGLFAGDFISYPEMMEMETYFDDHWCFPKRIMKEYIYSFWKKWNPDYLTAAWYLDRGKDLNWDFLFCHPWDLLMLEPVEKYTSLPSQDDVLIYPTPSKLRPLQANANLPIETDDFDYVFFHQFMEGIIGEEFEMMASEAFFATWSRKSLETLAPFLQQVPGKMQYRLPTLLEATGFQCAYLPRFSPELMNNYKTEISADVILSEFLRNQPKKLFHPVYNEFKQDTLKQRFNILPTGQVTLKNHDTLTLLESR